MVPQWPGARSAVLATLIALDLALVQKDTQKKIELAFWTEYPAFLSSRLVNNAFIEQVVCE